MPKEPLQIEINIGSRFENIDLVDLVADAILRHAALDEEGVERMGLAIREAVANGVQHGNGEDPKKRVSVSFVLDHEAIEVQIRDQGDGFDLESLPDPLAPENLFKPRGRGILLMNTFMDKVDFQFQAEGGTVVTLKKSLPAAESGGKGEDE